MALEPGGRTRWRSDPSPRDRCQAAAGGRADLAGTERGRGDPRDRGQRGDLRDELLNGEIFYTLKEAQIVIESWRRHYNTVRPHGALGYRPPAPEVFMPAFTVWPAASAKLPVVERPTVH